MDYNKDTLNAYKNETRALEYKQYHTNDWSWARLVTWIEQRLIVKELNKYNWEATNRILDIPCGTGILGNVLGRFPFKVVASDISKEMMALANVEYRADQLEELICSDITKTVFQDRSFDCVITLGFLHRVPWDIKVATIKEISRLTNRVAIISFSKDNFIHRLKNNILSYLMQNHIPAPCAVNIDDIKSECELHNFNVVSSQSILPLFSAHSLLVLEKSPK